MSLTGYVSNLLARLFREKSDKTTLEALADALDGQIGGVPQYVFLGPEKFGLTTPAVPTYSVTNNVAMLELDAGDETAFLFASISNPFSDNSSATSRLGLQLTQIKVLYKVATEALDGITATLQRQNVPVEGAATVGTLVATTDVTPLTVDEHTGTMTVDTPEFTDGKNQGWVVSLLFDKAATSLLTFYGVQLKFEMPA